MSVLSHAATSPVAAHPNTPHCSLLPRPFPTHTYAVGDLLTDLRTPGPTTLRTRALSARDYDDTRLTAYYKDVATISPATGNFTRSLGGELLVRRPKRQGTRFCSIAAEKSSVRALKDPVAAFAKTVRADGAQAWLLRAAAARKPVYWVAAVREVTNASYAHAATTDAGNGLLAVRRTSFSETQRAAEPEVDENGDVDGDAMRAKARGHRRRDSAFEEPTCTKTDVLGAEIREVRVRVTRADVPHSTKDLKCRWTYLKAEVEGEEVQLAVGLGAPLDQEEVADLWEEEELGEEEEEEEDDDDDE